MRRKALALLCALSLVLLLAGCGRVLNQEAVGSYQLTGMADEDGTDMTDQLDLLEAFGYTVWLDLEEDGTGTMNQFGELTEVKWTNSYIEVGNVRSGYRLDGDELVMKTQDGTWTLTRVG